MAAILQISIKKDSRPSEFSRPLTSITLNLNANLAVDRHPVSLLKLPIPFLFVPSSAHVYEYCKAKTDYLLDIQTSVCYILKHLEDGKTLSVHIYYTCCDIILIFKLHRRTRLTPHSYIHSLKIRTTSHPCNKSEQITLSYLLRVNYLYCDAILDYVTLHYYILIQSLI